MFRACSILCSLADGQRCNVTDAVDLHVRLLAFTWDHEFKMLKGGPFPMILGLDFLDRTGMLVDVGARKFSFRFARDRVGSFIVPGGMEEGQTYLIELRRDALNMSALSLDLLQGDGVQCLRDEFPRLFSEKLGTAQCVPYDIELSDLTPVRSPPYRCAFPKAAAFKKIVNDLLEQGVVRVSKSPTPARHSWSLNLTGTFD
jgi:hypothetical protein